MSIEQNIQARLAAQQIAELAAEEATAYGPRVWAELAKIVHTHVPPPAPVVLLATPLSDAESREFGQQAIDFGKHQGKTYDECPLAYLEWLSEQNRMLLRYLASRRIQAEAGE